MKKLKFLTSAVLFALAAACTFSACDKDDDDDNGNSNNDGTENGQTEQQVEQMKGGNIVGTWLLDEANSSSTINGEPAEVALGDYANYVNVSSIVNVLGDIVTFTEDLKMSTATQKGSYKTNAENLSVTLPISETSEFTIEGGTDLSSLITAKNPALEGVVSATLNSFSYTVENNVLTVQVYATVSADIKALSALLGSESSTDTDSKLVLPVIAKFAYKLKAESDDETLIGSWILDATKTTATINNIEDTSFLGNFGLNDVNIGEVVNVLGETVTFNADSTVVAGDKAGTFHTDGNALSVTLTTTDGTVTYAKGTDLKELVASQFGSYSSMVSSATLTSLTYIVDNKHLTVKMEASLSALGQTMPINASFEYDLKD